MKNFKNFSCRAILIFNSPVRLLKVESDIYLLNMILKYINRTGKLKIENALQEIFLKFFFDNPPYKIGG